MMDFKKTLRDLIGKGKEKKAIEILKEGIANDDDLHNLSLIESRYSQNENEKNSGIITSEAYKTERTKIGKSLKSFLDKDIELKSRENLEKLLDDEKRSSLWKVIIALLSLVFVILAIVYFNKSDKTPFEETNLYSDTITIYGSLSTFILGKKDIIDSLVFLALEKEAPPSQDSNYYLVIGGPNVESVEIATKSLLTKDRVNIYANKSKGRLYISLPLMFIPYIELKYNQKFYSIRGTKKETIHIGYDIYLKEIKSNSMNLKSFDDIKLTKE